MKTRMNRKNFVLRNKKRDLLVALFLLRSFSCGRYTKVSLAYVFCKSDMIFSLTLSSLLRLSFISMMRMIEQRIIAKKVTQTIKLNSDIWKNWGNIAIATVINVNEIIIVKIFIKFFWQHSEKRFKKPV